MTDPKDFLARWSRRKREAERAERRLTTTEPVNPAADSGPRAARDSAAEDVAQRLPDLTKLPPIESITADTDVRAFLAPGVPQELKLAALSRAFAVDPKIRDFIEVADYDFDFHTPGAISGFGPLEMTDELRQEVARIVDSFLTADEPPSAPTTGVTSQSAAGPAQPVSEIDASQGFPQEPGQPKAPMLPNDSDIREENRSDFTRAQSSRHSTSLQHENSGRGDLRFPPRRTHGRALPE